MGSGKADESLDLVGGFFWGGKQEKRLMVGRGAHVAVPGGMNRASPRQRVQKHPPLCNSWMRGSDMGAVSGFPSLFSCSSPHHEALWPVCLSVRITPCFCSHRFGVCLGGALRFPTAWLYLVCSNSMNSHKDPSLPAAAWLPLSGVMTAMASPAEDKSCCCLWSLLVICTRWLLS